ncbi:MAG TPA: hypothetical protein VF608_11940 [Thermoanaerobaculia bacterium]
MRVIAVALLLLCFVPAGQAQLPDHDVVTVHEARQAERDAHQGGVSALADCPAVGITPPVTINGQLKTTTCKDFLGLYEDVYSFYAYAGQSVEINYSSRDYETFLYMWVGNTSANSELVSFLSSGTSRRRIRHTFATSGVYYIEAESLYSSPPNTGAYTLSVSFTGGNSNLCTANATTACLLNGRYKATARYRSAFDNNAVDSNAQVKSVTGFASGTNDTVFFYFNSESNIELMLKMLDQGNTNSGGQQTMAVLYGIATPLRVELTITDTKNGAVKTYVTDFGKMTGGTDFTAFLK